jgi:DNA replication regulator DPB11
MLMVGYKGRFDEAAYQVRRPRPERRVGEGKTIHIPFDRSPLNIRLAALSSQPQPPTHVASSPDEGQTIPQSKSPPPKLPTKPPTNTKEPDDEDEEPACVKRVPAETLQMWETLLKPRGFEITAGKLVRSPSKSQGPANASKSGGTSTPNIMPPVPEGAGSIIDSFRRANSFTVQKKGGAAPRQPFKRVPTSGSLLGKGGSSSSSFPIPPQNVPEPSSSGSSSGLFRGIKVRALGEAKSSNVRSAVEGGGGRMASEEEPDEEVDYIVVRLVRYVDNGD